MIQNTFTVNGEIRHRLRRQHSIYMSNLEWEKLKEYSKLKRISVSELILKLIEKENLLL